MVLQLALALEINGVHNPVVGITGRIATAEQLVNVHIEAEVTVLGLYLSYRLSACQWQALSESVSFKIMTFIKTILYLLNLFSLGFWVLEVSGPQQSRPLQTVP